MKLQRKTNDNTISLYDGPNLIFQMTEAEKDGAVELVLSGSLRSDAVHDLQDELAALAGMGMDLVLDFSKVTYLSSACQQALLVIQQQMDRTGKGSLTICKLPGAILKELESTGISELLMIEE